MSNCITIHKGGRVTFPTYVLDLGALVQKIEEARNFFMSNTYGPTHPDGKDDRDYDDNERRMSNFWWYAMDNYEVHGGNFTLDLNSGRSSHTWRSIRALLWSLEPFILEPFEFELEVEDEGFPGIGPMKFGWGEKA